VAGDLRSIGPVCRVGAPVWVIVAITLITGPANAGKARAVLDAVRRDAARGMATLLVVPTRADVERYRGELVEGVLDGGVRVERFQGLLAEVVRRAGLPARALPPLLRRRVLAAVAARVSASPELAARPGFVAALAALVEELQVERVTPARLRQALSAWVAVEQGGEPGGTAERPGGGDGAVGPVAGNERRARELGDLFAGYHELLERLGCADPTQSAAVALDALRHSPGLWRGTPVHLYGFDDLTRLQLDAIETLGRVVDAPMTLSLPYEAGRVAFAGRAGAYQTLLPCVAEHRALPARAEYYADSARGPLHHLERGLFEEGGDIERVDPAGAVRLLEGGSPRAELELVTGEIRALLDGGVAPGDIALVHRSPQTASPLIAEVLDEAEIPVALPLLRTSFGHTALGRALCGLLAAAFAEGNAADLLAWLRAPGVLEHHLHADRLEASARRQGLTSVAAVTALWEQEHGPLPTLRELREAAGRGPLALIERVQEELQAAVAPATEEERAFALATQALTELADLARLAPQLAPHPGELSTILRALEVPAEPPTGGYAGGAVAGEDAVGGAVAVLDPLSLRARRVRALFLCGLQADVFPAVMPAPAPWLSEEERRGLALASGLRLATPETGLAAERYLFYAAISRPAERLFLSWHSAGEDGESAAPSLFVDDVCDLFAPELRSMRSRRVAGAAHWPGPGAPPLSWAAREQALAAPPCLPPTLQPLRDEQLLAELRHERLWSASGLKDWHGCPARWFLERVLHARDIEPSGEPLARGGLAHAALRDTLDGLRQRYGSARLSPACLPAAKALLHEALARHAPDFPLSVAPERIPGVRRRLEADLERYLAHACEQHSPLEPTHLELDFGFAGEDEAGLPPLDLGEGVRVRGRIDRIDLAASGQAVLYDYKGAVAPPAAKWLAEGHLQLPIYMRAVEQLLQNEVAGGFYQPLAGRDLRARGVLDADSGLQVQCVRGDAREHAEVQALIDEMIALARKAAHEADRGLLEARPGTCGFGDGACMYPSICRCQP
jgi:ATP-dependent helicase/DNAse subunit B